MTPLFRGGSEQCNSTASTSRRASASLQHIPRLGKIEAGQPHVAKILESRPNFSVAKYRIRILYRGNEHKDHIAAGLLSAGLSV